MIEGLLWQDTPFISIDTETTGFSRHDRICEIALVVARGTRVLEVFHSLVNPGCPIDPGATGVHGIQDADVVDSPPFEEIKAKVLRLLRTDMPWVAHQLAFDTRMLSYVIPREEWPQGITTLCTMEYAKKHHPILRMNGHHKLLDVAGSLHINYDPNMAHNALNDAEVLRKIVPEMMADRRVDQHFTKLSHEWLK